jgi:hypothetical protein
MLSALEFSIWIGVASYGFPISSQKNRIGAASFALMNIDLTFMILVLMT